MHMRDVYRQREKIKIKTAIILERVSSSICSESKKVKDNEKEKKDGIRQNYAEDTLLRCFWFLSGHDKAIYFGNKSRIKPHIVFLSRDSKRIHRNRHFSRDKQPRPTGQIGYEQSGVYFRDEYASTRDKKRKILLYCINIAARDPSVVFC